jgi:uncharacterized protein (DUF427 family)
MQRQQSTIATDAPRVEPDDRHVVVRLGGETVADSRRAIRLFEDGHPPAYYIPPEDVRVELLEAIERQTECPLKGIAHYYDIEIEGERAGGAAWCYPEPKPGFEVIQHAIAFYPAQVEATIDGKPVMPEENPYYGGWVVDET